MLDLSYLALVLPLAGFVVLALFGRLLSRGAIAVIGVGSVGLAALVSVGIAWQLLHATPPVHEIILWRWFASGGLAPAMGLHIDGLAVVMMLVVTVVGLLIHLYAAEYMAAEEGYARFFAYMNLFVFSMLLLVMADNLLLLYFGWEGVGLCSYLLIGFWYKDPANGLAARKAFIVTRVGDTALALALFIIISGLGSLDIQVITRTAPAVWAAGSAAATAAAWLILGGAVGKSAQLPLQTWLPDAMAGPTPVSALIHAATMVTAGVYLVARMHPIFTLAPSALAATGIIGAAGMLLAAFAALAQPDIKRALAYSTMSQIGLMFLALGVGAWTAAIFHLMTHAFFKALLFLAAGAVIEAQHHNQNIFRMGGLRREMPFVFWTFLIGGASLAAVPLVTAGFYSKDAILYAAFSAGTLGRVLWVAGIIGAFLTSLYIFRLIFIVFYGERQHAPEAHPGWRMRTPLAVLALLSLVGGFVEVPHALGGKPLFAAALARALPTAAAPEGGVALELLLQAGAGIAGLFGIYVAYLWYVRRRPQEAEVAGVPALPLFWQRAWLAGWGFDRLYDLLLVRPFTAAARLWRSDLFDIPVRAVAGMAAILNALAARTENGQLRWYAAFMVLGLAIILAAVLT